MELYEEGAIFGCNPLNHMRDMEQTGMQAGERSKPLNHMRDMELSTFCFNLSSFPLNHMRDMELNNNTRNERFFNNLN